jgi:predicted transcriptional regulator
VDLDAPQSDDVKRRFSPTRLATHRQKTGLSAADYGALVGISGQSIYHYEQGKARPHADVVRKLSMLKELSKTQLLALLEEQKQPSK